MEPDILYNDWTDRYITEKINQLSNLKIKNEEPLSDEEVLERMDMKTIENFLRKKKLNNINK